MSGSVAAAIAAAVPIAAAIGGFSVIASVRGIVVIASGDGPHVDVREHGGAIGQSIRSPRPGLRRPVKDENNYGGDRNHHDDLEGHVVHPMKSLLGRPFEQRETKPK